MNHNDFKGGNPTLNEINLKKYIDDTLIMSFENKIKIILNEIIKQKYKYVNKSIMSEFEYYKYNDKNKYQLFNNILSNLVNFYIDEDKRTNILLQKYMINIIESIKTNNDVIIFLKQIFIEIIKHGNINSIPEDKKYEEYFNFEPHNEWKYSQKCFTKKFIDEKIYENEIDALFELYIISKIFRL